MGNKLGKHKGKKGKVQLVSVTKKSSTTHQPQKQQLEKESNGTPNEDSNAEMAKDIISEKGKENLNEETVKVDRSTNVEADENRQPLEMDQEISEADSVKLLEINEDYVIHFYDAILAEAFKDVIEINKKQKRVDENREKQREVNPFIKTNFQVSQVDHEQKTAEPHQKVCNEKSETNDFDNDNSSKVEIPSKCSDVPSNDQNGEELRESLKENEIETDDLSNKNETSQQIEETTTTTNSSDETYEIDNAYLKYGEKLSLDILAHVKLHLV